MVQSSTVSVKIVSTNADPEKQLKLAAMRSNGDSRKSRLVSREMHVYN